MPKKRSEKTKADWANVLRIYDEVIKEKGDDAPWLAMERKYQLVAQRTKYATETVKRIINNNLKTPKKTDKPH